MGNDTFLRRVLLASAAFNVGGAATFGFPASPLGQMAGLPGDVPVVYRAFVVLFVLLFAGAYAWLAAQPAIDRPMVVFSAIGKTAAVALVAALCVAGHAPARAVPAVGGDLVLAALFMRGLALAGRAAATA
jgi:hypothetical protein